MVDLALQRPLSFIGVDTEFRYRRPPVLLGRGKEVYDIRSIHPLLLSIALVEPCRDGGYQVYPFVVDVRDPGIAAVLHDLFRIPVCFVGHNLKVELFCFWQLGIPAPGFLWDTYIFEKFRILGRYHPQRSASQDDVDVEAIRAKEEILEQKQFRLSLSATCLRYGISHRFSGDKEALQRSFLIHEDDKLFSPAQIEYSAEDAVVAAQLYIPQTLAAVEIGAQDHLNLVEMPWTRTNARIEWNGFRVHEERAREVTAMIETHQQVLKDHLAEMGLENENSHKQILSFFRSLGIHRHFLRDGKYTFSKKVLKKYQELHPAIQLMRDLRRAGDIRSDKIMHLDLIGVDGRVHPQHQQLGTDTGRQTSRWPNILGLDAMLRPIVIPEDGYGIGEADWSQVEVGVAAAVYGDPELLRMYNSGDVYSAMAQRFYSDQIRPEDLSLPGPEFKAKYKKERNRMKLCTLGMIYGISPYGLSDLMEVPRSAAAEILEGFMSMFPTLRNHLSWAVDLGAIRGHATAAGNVRRYRNSRCYLDRGEQNWLKNHPVQGSAAVIFKYAGNRLDRLYKGYGARIIIPLHDSFVFEAPLEHLEQVAEETCTVMLQALREYYPDLEPRVEVNIDAPQCWNKDGETTALQVWLERWTGVIVEEDSSKEEQ